MKRLISLGIALLLVLSAVCCASAEGKTFKTPYFTLTLPSGWDGDTGDAEVDEDGMEYLGYLGEDKKVGLFVEAYLMYYEDFKDVSLWNADQAEIKEYAEIVLDDYADDDPEWIDTVMAGKIPFVLIQAEDEDGEYLYADTMTNGYAIIFIAYVLDEDGETEYPITQKHIDAFKSILETFQPVS